MGVILNSVNGRGRGWLVGVPSNRPAQPQRKGSLPLWGQSIDSYVTRWLVRRF